MSRRLKFLITAGPTREPVDPVRFLSNRSSGKMGYAIAQAAVEAGHEVTLVSGPVALDAPASVELHRVETAQEMFEAVRSLCQAEPAPDISVHAAAVADYRPRVVSLQKIKKQQDSMLLELERTPDVLGSMREPFGFRGFLTGFAAETENLIANAQEKLRRKGCDLVIANDVSEAGIGFNSDDNAVVLCHLDGTTETLGKMSKRELAKILVALIVTRAMAENRNPKP